MKNLWCENIKRLVRWMEENSGKWIFKLNFSWMKILMKRCWRWQIFFGFRKARVYKFFWLYVKLKRPKNGNPNVVLINFNLWMNTFSCLSQDMQKNSITLNFDRISINDENPLTNIPFAPFTTKSQTSRQSNWEGHRLEKAHNIIFS